MRHYPICRPTNTGKNYWSFVEIYVGRLPSRSKQMKMFTSAQSGSTLTVTPVQSTKATSSASAVEAAIL